MQAWVEHGFNVWDGGKATVDRVQPLLRRCGYEVREMDYGWTGLLGVLLRNDDRALELSKKVLSPSLGVGHSNGATLLHRASYCGAKFERLVYINPALDLDAVPAPSVRRVDVFHARDDHATWAAKWLPWSLWGDMGQQGYRGRDTRMRSWDLWEYCAPPVGHSGVFSPRLFEQFENLLGRVLREEVG